MAAIFFLVAIPLVFLITFKYVPMAGVIIAFKDYSVVKGIYGSEWAGLKYFQYFFDSPNFALLLKNTIGLSIYGLIAGTICPIVLALALNEIRNARFKKMGPDCYVCSVFYFYRYYGVDHDSVSVSFRRTH